MKTFLLLLCAIFTLKVGYGQDSLKNHEFISKEFNWKIVIPDNFTAVSLEDWAKFQNKGAKAIEDTYGQKIENKTKTIFVFKSDGANYFEANCQPYDVKKDGSFLKSCKGINDVLYTTFKKQIPGAKIDSASLITKINNLRFNTFILRIEMSENVIFNVYSFSRLFLNKELCVNIVYLNNNKGDEILDAWKNSTFSE